MERLTMKNIENQVTPLCRFENCDTDSEVCPITALEESNCDYFQATLNRLYELEDKLENGLMVELPCKAGDTIYFVSKLGIQNVVVYEVYSHDELEHNGRTYFRRQKVVGNNEDFTASYVFNFSHFGQCVFLTRSDAEAELERRKSNE